MKRIITPNVGENVEQLKLAYNIGVSLKWYNILKKTPVVSYTTNIHLSYDSIILLSEICPSKMKTHIHKNTFKRLVLTALLIIVKNNTVLWPST